MRNCSCAAPANSIIKMNISTQRLHWRHRQATTCLCIPGNCFSAASRYVWDLPHKSICWGWKCKFLFSLSCFWRTLFCTSVQPWLKPRLIALISVMWHCNYTDARAQCVSALSALPFFFPPLSFFAHGTPRSRSNWICMDQNETSLIDSEALMPWRRQRTAGCSQLEPNIPITQKAKQMKQCQWLLLLLLFFWRVRGKLAAFCLFALMLIHACGRWWQTPFAVAVYDEASRKEICC